ncbi:hypothetical protein AaE_007322, partial [Aphanomyces astaci]
MPVDPPWFRDKEWEISFAPGFGKGRIPHIAIIQYLFVMPKSNVPPRPDDPSYNHQFATVNGIRMHYVDVGPRDGLILVLVHGGPTCGMDGG